jgi:hypothetical protein
MKEILTIIVWIAFVFQSAALAIYCRKILKSTNIEAVAWPASLLFMLASLITATYGIINHVPLVYICASFYAVIIEGTILIKVWRHEEF